MTQWQPKTMNGSVLSRFRLQSCTVGVVALVALVTGCSDGGNDVVANASSAQLSADALVADETVDDVAQADATGGADALALPEPAASTDQSILVVLSDGGAEAPALTDSESADETSDPASPDDPATDTSTTASTVAPASSETTVATVAPTTVQSTVTTTVATTAAPTTTAPTTAAPTTAAPTTAAPTTAAPTTTTTRPPTTATQPPGNSSFPDEQVVMVSSGAQATFSSQVANSGPVVIWFWLPG